MIRRRSILTACLVLGLAGFGLLVASKGAARADDVDAKKLLGKWELTTVNGGKPEFGLDFEFLDGGRLNYTFSGQSGQGQYGLRGNKLSVKLNPPKGAKRPWALSTPSRN
jgi:hypothetical protein